MFPLLLLAIPLTASFSWRIFTLPRSKQQLSLRLQLLFSSVLENDRSSNKLPFIWPFHTPVCLFLSNVTFVSCWLLLFSPVSLRQSLLSHFLHPSYFYIYCSVVPSISQICNLCRVNLILTLIFLYFSALERRTFLQPCCKLFLFSNFL